MEHLAHMKAQQAKELGKRLRARREELGLSAQQLAEQTDTTDGTILRIESGDIAAPRPDKLARIADALGISLADVYALADYAVPDELPTFRPYLRSKYRELPAQAVDDLNHAFERIIRKHGYDPEGPQTGEDETL
jgi:transcriptional regulator with XRE-family HTH domain